jgi:hypothetical protein
VRCLRWFFPAAFSGFLVGACTDGTGPGNQVPLECTDASAEILAVGEHRILNPIQDDACVRLPQAGATGAQHLYVPVATAGDETDEGASAPYSLTGASPATAAPPAAHSPLLAAFQAPVAPAGFHAMLRARERALSESPSAALFNEGRARRSVVVPPVVGEQRTFNVCTTRTCTAFTEVVSTARVVGQKVAIFLDNAAPAGGYSDPELMDVGNLFDDFLYPIDTVAFGRESDIDGNEVVIVLLTHRVNALTPDCNTTGSVILGYFFGADLLPRSSGNPGSNEAEIFYGMVPDPNNPACDISLDFARSRLPVTFIHEFQHMISFNQHVLARGGRSEDTWLNEGLSHFAEELGGRLVPDVECPVSGSCRQDFMNGNVENAFEYLTSPEDHFLIEPGNSSGELAERGANWLFVRWLVDHFAADSVLGGDFTRRLVATTLLGAANVQGQTSSDFSALVPEWQLSNYLDDLSGFNQPAARLRYKTWNLRDPGETLGHVYPLVADVTPGPGYTHTGVLRAGSGRHVLVTQASSAAPVDLRLTASSGAAPVSSSADPRIGLVRVR